MKYKNLCLALYSIVFCTAVNAQDFTQYVNPFIGTGGNGHVFPGATLPFGAVQLSPDQKTTTWEYCSGYRYLDSTILGFSHTHLSGTGVGDLGDILLMPYLGKKPDTLLYPGKSSFSHAQEKASPGYYQVLLNPSQINVQLTTTERVGLHKYSFPKSTQAMVYIDLKHKIYSDWGKITESEITKENDTTFTGYRLVTQAWAPARMVYFVIRTSKPITTSYFNNKNTDVKNAQLEKGIVKIRSQNVQVNLQFNTLNNPNILIKVALSTVSLNNAKINLQEIPHWDFDVVAKQAKEKWNSYLKRAKIEADEKTKTIFYTALYHTFIQPNQLADKDSSYYGPNYAVQKSKTGNYYSTFSLWDTYRSTHTLYTLFTPERVPDMVNTLLQHHQTNGYLPIWTLGGTENHCMIANHAVPVIVEAINKGFANINANQAYEAIKASLTTDHQGSYLNQWKYNTKGYMAADSTGGSSVSKTLEFAYDDWCAAQLAKKLGKVTDYNFFLNRSNFYKNHFNKQYNMMWPKKADGSWLVWDKYKTDYAGPYTEGNAWQYIWAVQHDPYGLISLFPNKQACINKLDSTFTDNTKITGNVGDVTGIIGQYAHGNEPSHHTAYMFNFLGQPWKTQKWVRQILATQYHNQPDGLSGNEDCGQMSSWYVLSAMGFYPFNPANGIYILGSPALSKATLTLGKNTFTIATQNFSAKNIYVKAIKLNGKPYTKTYIKHSDMVAGGQLQFFMTDKPITKTTAQADMP